MAHNELIHFAKNNQDRRFSFEKLGVWTIALDAMAACDEIAGQLPRPYGEMADQLRRGSLSIVCNLAEGVGREGLDQVRFFRMARGSTYEAAAIIEAAARRRLVNTELHGAARRHLLSVAALLTRHILR